MNEGFCFLRGVDHGADDAQRARIQRLHDVARRKPRHAHHGGDGRGLQCLQHGGQRIIAQETVLLVDREGVIPLLRHDFGGETVADREPAVEDRLSLGPQAADGIACHGVLLTPRDWIAACLSTVEFRVAAVGFSRTAVDIAVDPPAAPAPLQGRRT
jgi:hypothetical protein